MLTTCRSNISFLLSSCPVIAFWNYTITKNGKTRALKRKNTSKMHKNGFFLNWVEHAILEVHSHSNRSQNFASFSKNPPEKKNCRKRSVKKLFISSLKKGWSVAKTFLLGKCISLFIDGVLVFKVSKVWGLVPSSLIHELIVHQGSYTFLRVEEPHFALVWKGAVSHLVSKLSIWLSCSPLKVSNFLIEIKWDLFIVQSLQHNLH